MTRALPGLSHYFGIQPWDLGRLTTDELDAYLDELAELNKAVTQAARR